MQHPELRRRKLRFTKGDRGMGKAWMLAVLLLTISALAPMYVLLPHLGLPSLWTSCMTADTPFAFVQCYYISLDFYKYPASTSHFTE